MTTTTPKPGPHLHTPTTTAEAAPDPQRPIFRELAKRHAATASDYMDAAANTDAKRDPARFDNLIALAMTAAEVSIACSHISPPARLRYVHRTEADK